MANRKLDQYKGRLSAKQIAEGMNTVVRNSVRLVEDAELLLENKRFSSAASLAVLAIEESGKLPILSSMSVARDDKDLKESWSDYRSHTKKNVAWIVPDLVRAGARKLEDFRQLYGAEAEHQFVLDQIKQIGFYTDCLGKAHWSVPYEVVEEELASNLVKVARNLTSKKEVTEKEIELWVKHLGPVWKKHMQWMQKALENWYKEMQEVGLAPEGPNAMSAFIGGKISITENT
jgi:AbiV family abortive infection protein